MSVADLERRLAAVAGERAVRFVEFLGVGATGMLVDLAVTTSALGTSHYLLANALGFLVAVSWNFAGNWLFVFNRPSGSVPHQYASYVGLHTATFGLRALVLTGLVELAGAPVLVATVLGIGVAAIANYLGTETILEDGIEWFDAASALNSVAHVVYHSRLRQALRKLGLYSLLYGAYAQLLATIYQEDTLTIRASTASGVLRTEQPPEIVSVLHTLEKERPVIEMFVEAIDEDDVVWDVGANLGVYSVLAGDCGEYVVAFEPVTTTSRRCVENLERNGVDGIVLSNALGTDHGEATLALERDELGTQTPALDDTLIDARETTTVEVEVGDELIEADRLPAPEILKVDVEGTEVAVLDGLERTLAEHIDVVLVETHDEVDVVRKRLVDAGLDVRTLASGGQTYLMGERP